MKTKEHTTVKRKKKTGIRSHDRHHTMTAKKLTAAHSRSKVRKKRETNGSVGKYKG